MIQPTAEHISVRLFGKAELQYNGISAVEDPLRPSMSWLLLKYLVVNRGREVDLEELLGTIWPDEQGANAEGAARVRLNRLRAILKPLGLGGRHGLVLYSAQKYSLNPVYTVHTDADIFTELLLKLKHYSIDDPEGLALCAEGLELFRGPYLKHTKKDFWFESVQESYYNDFCHLAADTAQRISAVGETGMDLLPLLSQRVLDIAPGNLELHRAVLSCFALQNRETERRRHTTQLMRAGVVSDWIAAK